MKAYIFKKKYYLIYLIPMSCILSTITLPLAIDKQFIDEQCKLWNWRQIKLVDLGQYDRIQYEWCLEQSIFIIS